MKKFLFWKGVLISLPFLLISCTKNKVEEKPLSDLANKGKLVYLSTCIACHHVDPTKDGSIGPAVANSSLELITARIMKASYPPGYKPKRTTTAMPEFPHLEPDIKALHAYLNNETK